MALLTSCCFAFSLKSGTTILFVMYWWLSVTYVVLLLNYFSDHTFYISLLIGVIFIIWVVCASAGLYGLFNNRSPYYLVPEMVIDLIDCVLRFINLIYHVFTAKLLIPRYTTFGASWKDSTTYQIDPSENDGSIRMFVYNLLDEKYPLPDLFAAIDLFIRVYFLLVIFSNFQDIKDRKSKMSIRRAKRSSASRRKKAPSNAAVK